MSDRSVSAVFAALANDERLVIVAYLGGLGTRHPGSSISEIADAASLSRFSASRHLRILAAAGLVSAWRSGHAILHTICPTGFDEVEDWMYAHLPHLTTNYAAETS